VVGAVRDGLKSKDYFVLVSLGSLYSANGCKPVPFDVWLDTVNHLSADADPYFGPCTRSLSVSNGRLTTRGYTRGSLYDGISPTDLGLELLCELDATDPDARKVREMVEAVL
jgi:hypothetical protein